MKTLLILNAVAGIIVFGVMGFTYSKPPQSSLTASIKRGKAVYTQYCLACHQADGGGVPNMNPPLIKTKWVLGNKKELAGVVLKGMTGEIEIEGETYHNTMPAHAFLTDQQVADVLTYIRNSFKK